MNGMNAASEAAAATVAGFGKKIANWSLLKGHTKHRKGQLKRPQKNAV